MNGRYLLDTNIIIALFADEPMVKQHLAEVVDCFIPSMVIGELCYGARKSNRWEANLERIEVLIAKSTILECNTQTARQYGEVKHQLRLKGRPLPENDIWIASLALQYDLTLVTRDAHFQEVENLQTVAW
ncbi:MULTISPECIES: type II toxin-antitoxin system VapC family toxin [unclassified Roseofilum]|uniref:type II toxin-antitoxin system VapC family toxin n=1 Tax=unclassified Roseofilum TaxID=2620099 RepID=UPI000E7DB780|nr:MULTISPECIES: type II toxin-antitoxin system VapC family toxin [unclassified Roseofilum]MBP0008205.1 type II toxin-antitoxin system VapC family toxin [Roseofilum sp. Belize Diploria]MBP0033675.1 type II toxin-antitoxin system VapC family toxin [Roseofilum sp. Belize BBD 4]HBQ99827.1 VapC toxin family PIN domain ribonuclease [Cyanobacteria bacterium UBA11691]